MEEQKQNPTDPLMGSLKIRTMADDLNKAGPAPSALPPSHPAPATPPPPPSGLPITPTRPIAQTTVSPPAVAPPPLPPRPTPPPVRPVSPPPPPARPIPMPPPILEMPTPAAMAQVPASEPKKTWLVIAIIFAILILAGGTLYFAWPAQPIPCQTGQISESCLCGQEVKGSGFCCNNRWMEDDCAYLMPPAPLISAVNQTIKIEAKGKGAGQILESIKQVMLDAVQEETKPLTFKIDESPDKYAQTLDEVAGLLGFNLPSSFKENTDAFNLIVYANPKFATSTATSSPPTETEIRLVLVAKQKDSSSAQQIMTDWEPTMLDDLTPMILATPGQPATTEFQQTEHNGGIFRYLNLPTSTATVEYAVLNDLIIIATSKNSIFYVYDLASRL